MEEAKIEKLLKILENLPFEQWKIIKREIDSMYEREQEKSTPNLQLEVLKENLKNWCGNLRKYKV